MQLHVVPGPSLQLAKLPALQARWVTAILGTLPPAETRSTCNSCVRIPPAGQEMGPRHYHPDTKCCTYLPILMNFQVGAMLDDPEVSKQGRESIEWRIDQPEGVSPLGLMTIDSYDRRYHDEAFGRDPGLLCPHYLPDVGGCGVWQHRNAVCSTWFCRSERGGPSFAFWRVGLLRFFRALEDAAADWALFALGAEEGDWGPWSDKKAFYRACARLVNKLSWEDTLALGGGKIYSRAADLRLLYERLLNAPLVPEEDSELAPIEPLGAQEPPAEEPAPDGEQAP